MSVPVTAKSRVSNARIAATAAARPPMVPDATIGLLIGGAMLTAEVPTAEEMENRVEFL